MVCVRGCEARAGTVMETYLHTQSTTEPLNLNLVQHLSLHCSPSKSTKSNFVKYFQTLQSRIVLINNLECDCTALNI